mmetsp:Transcript_23817/g.32500  ORF Transcript_23817/g.32500 Transcript_23817/m.32500 type:complete len:126 (-) Transcript_23817:49-426(-)
MASRFSCLLSSASRAYVNTLSSGFTKSGDFLIRAGAKNDEKVVNELWVAVGNWTKTRGNQMLNAPAEASEMWGIFKRGDYTMGEASWTTFQTGVSVGFRFVVGSALGYVYFSTFDYGDTVENDHH